MREGAIITTEQRTYLTMKARSWGDKELLNLYFVLISEQEGFYNMLLKHMNFKVGFVQFGGSEGKIVSRLFLRLRRENVSFDFLVDRLYGVAKIRRSRRGHAS